jgi:hypothetical protein
MVWCLCGSRGQSLMLKLAMQQQQQLMLQGI